MCACHEDEDEDEVKLDDEEKKEGGYRGGRGCREDACVPSRGSQMNNRAVNAEEAVNPVRRWSLTTRNSAVSRESSIEREAAHNATTGGS